MKTDLTTIKPDMEFLTRHVKKCDVMVHSGRHSGWLNWLSTKFGAIFTFEPDLVDFIDLMQSVTRPNVFAMRALLGEHFGPGTMARPEKHSGKLGVVTLPIFRVDDLALEKCDAIYLDVQGSELQALRGAANTIWKFNPVVMVEDHRADDAELVRSFLQGYRQVERVNNSIVLCAH